MVNFKLLGLKDAEEWNTYLKKLSIEQQDIYFTPEYYQLYENKGDGKAQCFVYESDAGVVMYPFLINSVNDLGFSLNKQYFDIQGVYGYNGVLSNFQDQNILNSFFNSFDEYCKENNIISEFLRINPLLPDLLLHRTSFEIVYDNENVNVNLLIDGIFDSEYEYSTRKNVKKAIRNGLVFKSMLGSEINDDYLDSFCRIYKHTMDRNNADEYYYFDSKYFDNVKTCLGEKALFVFVIFDNQIISCELVMLGSKIAYSFLGGTLSEFYQYRPNDFLKHEAINLLKSMGFHNFLLGGGPEGVVRYKKTFSKNGVIPFYFGKKIHNREVYDDVVKQWSNRNYDKVEKYGNFTLKYRY